MTGVQCYDLRVEFLRSPIGVSTSRPRFSWQAPAAREPVVGFELEVHSSAGELLWQSGALHAADSVLSEYAGTALKSNSTYTWRVRAALEGDARTEWAAGSFETALLQTEDWAAEWVRPVQEPTHEERWTLPDWIFGNGPTTPVDQRLRPVQLLRHEFQAGAGVVRARLYATAHGTYTAAVNGIPADDQVLAPGFDSYSHRVSAQCYDVTAHVRTGPNVLGVTLADGWWAGRIGLAGASAHWGDSTSAVWELHLDYADGTLQVIRSGTAVRSAVGPWRYADLFVGELLDRRAESPGWDLPGFDDDAWLPVEVIAGATSTIVPFAGEPIRRVSELSAVSITDSGPDGFIIDFGQVIAGRVRLVLPSTRAGQVITIEHTETLNADGTWFVNIAGINKEQRDTYLAAGLPGGEVYEPTFSFHGFRYARISGLAAAPVRGDVTAVVLGSDLELTGAFSTSDARLNKLHENVVWSQRGNFLSIPTDCPQRERMGWSGDIQVFAAAAANNMNVAGFLTRWLANLRADQLADGQVPIFSPYSPVEQAAAEQGTGIAGIVSSAGWSDAIAIVPWTLYERYGDLRVLHENYEAMCRWIDYQVRTAEVGLPPAVPAELLTDRGRANHRVLYNTGDHFGDWLTPSTLRGRPIHEAIGIAPLLTSELVAPMFQAWTLTLAARSALALGYLEDALAHEQHAAAVRAAFAEEYVSPEGRLPVDLQGPYALALAFDMVPVDVRPALAEHLAALVEANGARLDTGFLSVPYLLDALWEAGYRDLARRVLWQPEMPSWLYEVDHGATTMWESWDAVTPDGTVRPMSMNHYAFGCVDDWLFRRVAGIQLTSPAYRSVLIDPDLDAGLTAAAAHVETPFGRLGVAWTREGTTATVVCTIPGGVDASLQTPEGPVQLPSGRSTHLLLVNAAASAAR